MSVFVKKAKSGSFQPRVRHRLLLPKSEFYATFEDEINAKNYGSSTAFWRKASFQTIFSKSLEKKRELVDQQAVGALELRPTDIQDRRPAAARSRRPRPAGRTCRTRAVAHPRHRSRPVPLSLSRPGGKLSVHIRVRNSVFAHSTNLAVNEMYNAAKFYSTAD